MSVTLRKKLKNERGAALFTAVLGLFLVTVLGSSLYMIADGAHRSSTNFSESNEAFYIAEAGLSHAIGLYTLNGQSFDISTIIPASGNGVSFGSGSYAVTTAIPQSNTRSIISTGVGANGAKAVIEAIVQFNSSSQSDAAIVVNGSVAISGGLQILGTQGVIHANGAMTLNGNNRAQNYYSATGTITRPGNQPCPNGSVTGAPPGCAATPDFRQNQPNIAVPNIDPATFFSQADYRLYPQNGSTPARITDKNGTILATNCQSGCWGGWTWNSGQGWVINSGSSLPSGTYYAVQSSIEVNRTFGSSGSPSNISFIADGSISFSGGASYMTPKATDASGRKYAVVAGDDVSLQGANLNTTNAEGTFYARDQFNLAGGQPKIRGNIFVYNLNDTPAYGSNKVQRQNGNSFLSSGDPQVTFNGNSASSGGGSTLQINTWREVRN